MTPTAEDTPFAASTLHERQLCERLWADCNVPFGSDLVSGSCAASGPLIEESESSTYGAWGRNSPAVTGAHTCHRLAREASRELVALLCYRNPAALAAVERLLPADIALASSILADTSRAPGVSLFDSVLAMSASTAPQADSSRSGKMSSFSAPCDESMFSSPRARIAATAAVPQSPTKGSTQSASWIQTSLWSGDADVPVALGRSGCLWWDSALCSPQANRSERQEVALRLKVAWFSVVPQSRAEHTGPTVDAIVVDHVDAESASDVPAGPASAPAPSSSGRYEPTILVIQTAKGGPQWRNLWRVLTHGPTFSPKFVWTRDCLAELRDWLWAEEAGLDRRRRQAKRSAQARGEPGKQLGVASAIAGAATIAVSRSPVKRVLKKDYVAPSPVDAGRAWFGYEVAPDQSHLIPDTRGSQGVYVFS